MIKTAVLAVGFAIRLRFLWWKLRLHWWRKLPFACSWCSWWFYTSLSAKLAWRVAFCHFGNGGTLAEKENGPKDRSNKIYALRWSYWRHGCRIFPRWAGIFQKDFFFFVWHEDSTYEIRLSPPAFFRRLLFGGHFSVSLFVPKVGSKYCIAAYP